MKYGALTLLWCKLALVMPLVLIVCRVILTMETCSYSNSDRPNAVGTGVPWNPPLCVKAGTRARRPPRAATRRPRAQRGHVHARNSFPSSEHKLRCDFTVHRALLHTFAPPPARALLRRPRWG